MGTDNSPLTYKNIISQFLLNFPEFAIKAEEEKKWWEGEPGEGPLVYIFFSNVVNISLVQALKRNGKSELLRRIFNFFEHMALSSDKMVSDLLVAGILEVLGDDKVVLKKARKLMAVKTLEMSHEVEKGWGRE